MSNDFTYSRLEFYVPIGPVGICMGMPWMMPDPFGIIRVGCWLTWLCRVPGMVPGAGTVLVMVPVMAPVIGPVMRGSMTEAARMSGGGSCGLWWLNWLSAVLKLSICIVLGYSFSDPPPSKYLSFACLKLFEWYAILIGNENSVNYLFAFLHNRQQTTTSTHNTKHITFIDQNAICNGDSGSHQN